MATQSLRVLCIHGVGHGEADPRLEPTWEGSITAGLQRWKPALRPVFEFVHYDDLFESAPFTPGDLAEAVARLTASGVFYGVGDLLGLTRDFGGIGDMMRWTAGMVVQWAESDKLRAKARQRVLDAVDAFRPDIVCAHSLGSLIGYDTFARTTNAAAIAGHVFVSFGSQIGNPFVRSALGGRIAALPARRWYHLFNPRDQVFTASLELSEASFQQVVAEFDSPGVLNHDADRYLAHPRAVQTVWRELAGAPGAKTLIKTARAFRRAVKKPQRRALLVGIDDYPDPQNRLEGCVNDVFLVSAVLQEFGFEPEDMRVVLNDRATAGGIVERLAWLLEGSEDGQQRVFFYSGHGAQLPDYGRKDEVDHKDECLVPYDFDWSRERAVTDDQFYQLYSQLPYETRFLVMLDCCHSGGLTRDGGLRVRGLNPPDDIRHRALKWNPRVQMWEQRELPAVNRDARTWKQKDFFGRHGHTRRLGRAALLRSQTDKAYDAACGEFGHHGPFLPVILEACQEGQLSYEYRHGVTSYGAFTYATAQTLREARRRRRALTWEQLVTGAGRVLTRMRYDETPALVCPADLERARIPW